MPSIAALPHASISTDTDDSSDEHGNANVAKATAMAVLFLCSFTLGCLPVKLNKWLSKTGDKKDAKDNQYIRMLLGVGGGVLFCTTFLHLLPEVAETFEKLDLTPDMEIHYAELLMCLGFFAMYLVEESVHVYLHRREKQANLAPLARSLSIRRCEMEKPQQEKTSESLEDPKPKVTEPSHNHAHNDKHKHVDHSHLFVEDADSTVKTLRGLLIVLALSVHELFEGLSVGLESSPSNVWYMFGAVAAHKLVIAFCIGVELVSSGMKTFIVVIYVFTFAVVSPLGIGIGMAVSNLEVSSADFVSVILQGLATGTLLYVVFFEILQNETKSGLRQWLSVFVGFAIMFGLTMIGD